MTTRGLTRTWLAKVDAVAALEASLGTARAEVVVAHAAMIASLGEQQNAANAAVVVDGRVVLMTSGTAREGLLVESEDE